MFTATLAFALATQGAVAPPAPQVQVRVDPGMEVVAITMWLAGRYPAPNDSTYKVEVWNAFRRYRDHPAVRALRAAKQTYPNLTEMGIRLTGWPNPAYTPIPGSALDANWRGYLGTESFDRYFAALPDFVRASGFVRFFGRHRREYDRMSAEFAALAERRRVAASLDAFFRYGARRARPSFEIDLEPLNGWGAHAIVDEDALRTGGERTVRYQLGYIDAVGELDRPVTFASADGTADVAWHEGAHVYVAPVFAASGPEIAGLDRLFNRQALASQNIGTWDYALNENVVRAIAAVLIRQARGEAAYERELQIQVERRGFIYTRVIADLILSEYLDKPGYADFDAFFPRILQRLATLPSPGA